MRKTLLSFVRSLFSVVLGIGLGLLITTWAGESPLHILQILFKSAFGSRYDFGMTLFYATPLIFTGLAVAIPLQAGLFNVGAEGQLNWGAFAAAVVASRISMNGSAITVFLAPVLAGLAAFAAGALWGAIPGWLRARRGSHEVINTIMLNFIAAGMINYLTLYVFKNPDSQYPETQHIRPEYALAKWSLFGDAPLGVGVVIALFVALMMGIIIFYTRFGYRLRAVGKNKTAAEFAGISSAKIRILALALGGGLAGLVGISEVLGNSQCYKVGFSPEFGFMGIAVALLGRSRPLGVVAAAFLFGALHKGSADLDLETEKITKEVALVFEALVILAVSAEGVWPELWARLKARRLAKERSKS